MSARFSPCRTWRYTLTREWGERSIPLIERGSLGESTYVRGRMEAVRTVAFVGLNPSTADETTDDPTIRKCKGFAKSWGYDRLVMLNIFALRSTDPKGLYQGRVARVPLLPVNVIGPENDDWIAVEAAAADMVVCAWGTHGALYGRGEDVAECLRGINVPLHVLGLTKHGHPKHPLYLRGDTKPTAW